ncbi:MAG: fibronectin type III domain-containing protein [Phycisphaerae bacterium]|nr:fibronectin type III domain-containing protein [Saprospiraceae bacterium]
MKVIQLFLPWTAMSMLLLSSYSIAAQCNPPDAFWLHAPQTSTTLTLNWSSVAGATQYQVRYWETSAPADKTVVDNFAPAPATLSGLKKSTQYSLEIRTKCGSSSSAWGASVSYLTANDPGSCGAPTGVAVSAGASNINVSWTSTGSHTIRYRLGASGDWLVPTGALAVATSPFSITGLPAGTYQVEVKHNCSATASNFINTMIVVAGGCAMPAEPIVTPSPTSALVELPGTSGVTGYNVEFRTGTTGNWIPVGSNIPPSNYPLNPPLTPSTQYQVHIQAICSATNSSYSTAATFTTPAFGSCLINKNFGKNLSAAEILQVNNKFNVPSPFTFGSMIGVNDGGLIFRSFQNELSNQITQLTTQLRNFHTMDEDFDNSLVNYDQNIKPKNTSPEGTPANTALNKGYYDIYHNRHGFNITSATELLQYDPQNWKEKIYKESDWSVSGPSGIKNSFENYTKKFIDEFAPANFFDNRWLAANFQVGNELWDYPVKADYHSLLSGARSAFVSKYGERSGGLWRMKLVVGAFQAFRDNNCASMLRDFSNCGGDLQRHDFIGDYLDLADCNVLKDLDAVDCHPYSFVQGTNRWINPEDPLSETWQIRNLAAWLDINKNNVTGVLRNTYTWSTEYGFDSDPNKGVGEKTQSAYLIRGLMMHSRFHYEKVFFYNAYDVARQTDQYYSGLFNSAGFWKLGTHPSGGWASPIVAHGAKAKPSWFGMLDLKTRFGGHVFYKALVEDAETYVMLIAKPDGTDPYLVFWAPVSTVDVNVNLDIPLNKVLNWSGLLAGTYKIETAMGQTFAETVDPGQIFKAATGTGCGTTNLTTIRRNPAFIRLIPCSGCNNITSPGSIAAPNPSNGNSPFNPGIITSNMDANGGSGGNIVYQWQKSSDNSTFIDISGATSITYDPPSLTQTTYYRRASKRSICTEYLYTPSVVVTVTGSSCPTVLSFKRYLHSNAGCNSAGDYYFEVVLNNVTLNDQITIAGLPANGVNVSLSSLNGVAFSAPSFHANLQYVSGSSLRWMVNPSNGATQTVKIYYCWVNGYPEPVALTTATSLCSGITTSCVAAPNLTDPDSEDRSKKLSSQPSGAALFTVHPNPGADQITLTYFGDRATQANLRILSTTGQLMSSQSFSELENQQQWQIETDDLPSGLYFLYFQLNDKLQYQIWQKL